MITIFVFYNPKIFIQFVIQHSKYICLILLSLFASVLTGQNITFHHLNTDNGLSQFSVNALSFDNHGVLWIGTREGLNRYDGNDITTYKLEKSNPNSLFCNNVLRIDKDQKDHLYLLCTEGVAEMNLQTQSFKTLKYGRVTAIYYGDALYIAQKDTIFRWNDAQQKFSTYYILPHLSGDIKSMLIRNNSLWIGCSADGLYKLDINSHQLKHIINGGDISDIYEDKDGNLWVGTWQKGLFCITPTGEIQNFKNVPGNRNSLSSNFVRSCCEDDNGNLWIGTFNGLNLYNKENGSFTHYTAENTAPNGLTHSSIWCIVKDKQGTLWMGTYFGGVNYFNPEYEIYTKYCYSPEYEKGLSSPIIGRVIEDDKNNLWIGTEGGGLNYYDRNNHTYKWYLPNKTQNSISEHNIKSMYLDSVNQILWIGTHLGGLDKLNLTTGKFTNYTNIENDSTTIPSNIVREIIPYKQQLLVATQNGVCLFNPTTGKAQQLFKTLRGGDKIKMVPTILLDKDGKLWLASTGEGVFSFDFSNNKLTNYRHNPLQPNSISNNNINYITQDSKGRLWFATSGSGIDMFRPESNDFINFDQQKNHLNSDCVYKIMESPISNKLILITNNGLTLFNPNTNKIENFNAANAFPITAINENGLYIDRKGEIFLGGINGMIAFNEKDLNIKSKPYHITLTKLFVNGEEIKPNDDSNILQKALYATPEIILNSKQHRFTIEFTTANYIAANKDEIVYQLKGFSDEWTSTRGNHSITYSNLSAGKYELTIKVKDKDTNIYPVATLIINVLPPWYKTTWAYLIYFILITGITWYIIRAYQARIKLKASLAYEQQHIKDIEELNQSKLRFFTNISHEFRTPLTMILAQVETLLHQQSFTPLIYNKILNIYKNSLQLRELITELLDFRKQEQGHMKIKVSPHNIVDFLYENYLLFLEYTDNHNIQFTFSKEDDNIEVWYDQKQMQKVVNNLLSNALKYTPKGGSIAIDIKENKENVSFSVTNSGEVITKQDIDKIFNRFYQIETEDSKDAMKAGTGIGLALTKGIIEIHHGTIEVTSDAEHGTCFTVMLPLGKECFKAEEISDKREQSQENSLSFSQPELNNELEELSADEISELSNGLPADKKMLIVEDNADIREMLAVLFAPYYQIVTAEDGEQGWEKVNKEMPDIVISDVVMPRMSGTELCKRIKSDMNTCHIPVVLLTARTAVEQNIEGLKLGADDYITKPFNTRLLISRCNNLVNSRILLQEKFSKQPQVYAQMLATNPIDKEILDRAIQIIEKHLDDTSFNVNVFAQEMMMARTGLFTKLKAITGQTPNDFILTIRLKKGAVMLRKNPELNVTEIADKIGFSSPRYFSKCFKAVYHVTPLNYRKGKDADDEEDEEETEK